MACRVGTLADALPGLPKEPRKPAAPVRGYQVKHVKVPNLICTLPGQTDASILVTAHTDRVTAGDGTVDNGSGASMLADLYQSLRGTPAATPSSSSDSPRKKRKT